MSMIQNLKLPAYDRRLWILFFGMALNQFGMSIVMPFISIYLYYYQGVSAGLVGFAMFASSFVGAIFQFVGGEMCDRMGRRFTFILGLSILITSFLLLGWAVGAKAHYGLYLLILCMTRVATGLFRPIPNIIATDLVPPQKRLEAFSLLRIGQNAGFALGPMVGGVMAMLSYSSMFYFTAVTSTIYLLLVIFFISDTRTCIPARRFTLKDLRRIPDDRPFMVFSILVFLVSVVYSQMYSPLSVYSKGFVGIPEVEIGMLFAINGIMVVVAQYFVTRLTDRYRLTLSMALGVTLYALGFGLVAFSHNFLMLALCIFIVTLGELTYMPPQTTLTANLSTEENRGRYQGFSGLTSTLGFAVGPLLGGVLLDHLPGMYVWLIVGTAGLGCALSFIYLRKLVPHNKNGSYVLK
ncbi:MFS transporter [Methanocella paludicola SANAE]|uniref:MFS transporter n=1 Tax=Methanocella paludicola (strain DSM 17711 / JCM 13418 / NBRC 101707 / SANAE) TaxID=304371 RepID=D1Z1Q5_METPS|nr:MFS transporter [Methanocella paludicola]BAI62627.1 MFS transporter [Methanocella paludicola SANAE]